MRKEQMLVCCLMNTVVVLAVLEIYETWQVNSMQSIYNPVQNGWDTHKHFAIICDFPLIFNEIALNPIDSPLPLFSVEYVRLSNRFCGHNNIEMGGGLKENKDVRDQKILFNKHSVATLFARDCSSTTYWTCKVWPFKWKLSTGAF